MLTIAVAADPVHADQLVHETWDHFANVLDLAPDPEALSDCLLDLIDEHVGHARVSAEAWAASLQARDPRDPGRFTASDEARRSADHAELLLRDLYANRSNGVDGTSAPAAWPSISRLLRPTDQAQVAELYSAVDTALDELPAAIDDALYLIDIEGEPLPVAAGLLGREEQAIYTDLVTARAHVRRRLNDYLRDRRCPQARPASSRTTPPGRRFENGSPRVNAAGPWPPFVSQRCVAGTWSDDPDPRRPCRRPGEAH